MLFSVHHLWLIPALPLAAAAAGAFLPRACRKTAAAAVLLAIAGSFALAAGALSAALAAPASREVWNFTWFQVGSEAVRVGWVLDPLSTLMATMVSGVGGLILVFSLGYMREDPEAKQFFVFMSFFAAAMLGVVLANSLLLLFVCWELVGLASFLLIGFWHQRPAAAAAARKAFLTTRLGDLGLFLGMIWLSHAGGALLFYDGGRGVLEGAVLSGLGGRFVLGGLAASTAIGLLLFCGAAGKSGQFPLHVWLPDAMEGPTPVSALIHAATMVAAGVFLLVRVHPLMELDLSVPGSSWHALSVVAGIGALTALLGAALALAQSDIKRVLAYSTISQLGYMMLAVGAGSWTAGAFHLLTHAFFKALLFLGAGSVILAAHHEQDIRRLGGLASRQRTTAATFAVGLAALAGVPYLFSGFWSKEAVLHAASAWPVSRLPLVAALIGVALTAFYSTRLMGEVFAGRPRSGAAEHARESPPVMTVPLILLAVGAACLGWIGTPLRPWLQSVLSGAPVPPEPLSEGAWLTALSGALVLAGIAAGAMLYWRRPRADAASPDPLAAAAPGIFAALEHRLWLDEFYAATVGRAFLGLAAAADWLDRRVWGGGVALLGRGGWAGGLFGRAADTRGLNAGFDGASATVRGIGRLYSRAQSGEPQSYLRLLAVGFVLLLGVIVFLAR